MAENLTRGSEVAGCDSEVGAAETRNGKPDEDFGRPGRGDRTRGESKGVVLAGLLKEGVCVSSLSCIYLD